MGELHRRILGTYRAMDAVSLVKTRIFMFGVALEAAVLAAMAAAAVIAGKAVR